jgi:hypothetical protein
MRKITIGLSTPRAFIVTSKLIRMVSDTPYSHVFIKMNATPTSNLNFPKVFQASHGDVNAIKYGNFATTNHIVREYDIEVSDEDYYRIANYLWEQLGKKYGFMQLLSIYTGIKFADNGEDKFICTELAAMVLESIGVVIDGDKDFLGLKAIKNILDDII